jgi:radical SAM protein with 4Fe4S-binding SPASM domain
MSITDFRAMLDVFTGTSVKTIDIMGGEPTMHADIVAFVQEAGRRGYIVNLSSNGSNLNILSKIMNLGSTVSVGISVNDRKTFEQVRGFIREHKAVVKMVFTRELDRVMIEEILALRPKRFYLLYRDIPDKDDFHEAVPFHVFKTNVEKDFGQQVGMVYCGGFLPDAKEHSKLGGVRCPAGTTKLGVMPDGSVYPCNLFFGKTDFSLGNILADRFTDIWHHRQLAFFRTFVANPCPIHFCRFHVECHGGCPAQSLLSTGDLSSADPRCRLH